MKTVNPTSIRLRQVLTVLTMSLLVSVPAAHAQVINTLEYFLTDDETKELNTGAAGDSISQKTIGNAVLRVKWHSPRAHEYYTWDNDYIYLRYDSTWGYDPIYHPNANSYEFTGVSGKGARWMKRQMSVGVPMSVTTSSKWYTNTCTQDGPIHTASYINTIVSYFPNYALGGNLGNDEVIVLKYDWDSSPADNYEYFFFSKKWGWVRWEHWANGQIVNSNTKTWNHIASRVAIDPIAKCVPFPVACHPTFNGCPGVFQSTGRQCLVQPPTVGECQTGFDWCFDGCCSRCN